MKFIFSITLNEFKKIFTDKGAILIILIAPIFYSFFYPYPYMAEKVNKIPTAVIDEDKSDLSRKIVSMLNSTEAMAVTTQYENIAETKNAFYEREVDAVIYIPHDFYANLAKGEQPKVTLFSDGSYMIFYSETLSYAMQVVLTASAGAKVQKMTLQGVPQFWAIKLQSAANALRKPLYNAAGGYCNYVVPSVLLLILQQLLFVCMFMIVGTDAERGYNFPTGATAYDILIGKGLAYFSLFLFLALYFFTIPMKIFGLSNFGEVSDKILFMIPYGLSVVFLGLAAGYLVREREGGILFIVMTSIPLLFLSGFAWPAWIMPEWLQVLRLVFPSSSGVYGFTLIRQLGADLNGVRFELINLWVLTFVYMVLAILAIKWQMGKKD